MKAFTHLRVASGYSFKYGTAHAHQLVERAANFEMNALGLTDRDGMAGAIRFVQSCEAIGLAPILGVNLSFVQKKYRITLLAQGGHLASLYRLLTAINMSNGENLLTHDLLERFSEYSKDILIMHGPESQLALAIAARRSTEALSIFNSTRDFFADQSLECISHQVRDEGPFSTPYATKLLNFARDNHLPAVITNAVRMLDRADGPVADVLDAARKLVPLSTRHVERQNSEAYLKSPDQMYLLADEIARGAGERSGQLLINTTMDWAERAKLSPRLDVGIGEIHLPEPSVVGAKNRAELISQLRLRCEVGVNNRYFGSARVKADARLEEELLAVRTLGYETYFLTVADITDMARGRGIRVAARGSGAGSLICYVLGISGVEPISHGLLMERFCSPLRGELPDIDIDVESARRLEIYDAVFARYGDSNWRAPGNQSRCATVSMVETYRARHAIRDVGAALGIPPMEIDLIAKSLPHIRSRNIAKALANLPELKNLNLNTPIPKMAIELAGRLDGLPRHLSMHPCAIALSDLGLQDHAPIELSASGYPMLQFDKDDVEAVGLLKLDVLGVRMQSAISYALSEIERTTGAKIDIDAIKLDDKPTFDLIKSTRTLGIFQIESPGQRELVGKFAPNTFTDLIIDISLFRPGPVKSDMIRPFLGVRQGFSARPIIHGDLEDILSETEGVVVFHEQVIRIIAVLTGASLAEADEKRRELGTLEGQQEVHDWFYPAALARGYTYEVLTQVWDILRAFAAFGFCKAHAAAFALPTYQSAWLKTHHTAAFIAGVLTHDPGMYPKRLILNEARQWGIEIAPVDINSSGATYRVESGKNQMRAAYVAPNSISTGEILNLPDASGYAIRMSLADVSGISESEVSTIVLGRPYLDLADFVYRSGASRPTTESLLMVGAFDKLHNLAGSKINRRDLFLHLQDLYRLTGSKSATTQNQMVFELQPPELQPSGLPDLTASEIVRKEVDILGMDISNHMMEFYGDFLNKIGAVKSSDLISQRSGASVLVAGVKVALQTPPVRSGRRVMFLTLDDGFGCNDVTFFEDTQNGYAALLRNAWLFLIRGEIRRTGPRGISLRATGAWELSDSYDKWRNLPVYESRS
ncbi:MAG: DNA polymerase III subunit alpha [Actinomycetales bacterium]|nr:MAG: DNA polymerase III subunit alpha [Actinomycetales bacterium]